MRLVYCQVPPLTRLCDATNRTFEGVIVAIAIGTVTADLCYLLPEQVVEPAPAQEPAATTRDTLHACSNGTILLLDALHADARCRRHASRA